MGFSLNQIKDQILYHSHRHETFEPFKIDQLAKRIANTVRREIYNFFDQGQFGLERHNANKSHKE